ncbi:hypothetical protein V6N13_042280 [Hibiscus sabdariffa]|uniref:Uncharacterized protein n=1 Tax=Hibiscus sabdariffa TaxID=183260 RepID=A0ABR2DEJ9_9ROSI
MLKSKKEYVRVLEKLFGIVILVELWVQLISHMYIMLEAVDVWLVELRGSSALSHGGERSTDKAGYV